MAHIVLISGSNRAEAQSGRVARVLAGFLTEAGAETDVLSLAETPIPMWDESKWDADKPENSPWRTVWPAVSARLKAADGFVVVTPEWHGMVPPMLKNLFCCVDGREMAFKPGYAVAVSAGTGGAYPIAELRMSSYKNSYLHWLPDHAIIRHVAKFRPGEPEHESPDFLVPRIKHGLALLLAYAEAAKRIRAETLDLDLLKTGM